MEPGRGVPGPVPTGSNDEANTASRWVDERGLGVDCFGSKYHTRRSSVDGN